jgi:hypothetical protein
MARRRPPTIPADPARRHLASVPVDAGARTVGRTWTCPGCGCTGRAGIADVDLPAAVEAARECGHDCHASFLMVNRHVPPPAPEDLAPLAPVADLADARGKAGAA